MIYCAMRNTIGVLKHHHLTATQSLVLLQVSTVPVIPWTLAKVAFWGIVEAFSLTKRQYSTVYSTPVCADDLHGSESTQLTKASKVSSVRIKIKYCTTEPAPYTS